MAVTVSMSREVRVRSSTYVRNENDSGLCRAANRRAWAPAKRAAASGDAGYPGGIQHAGQMGSEAYPPTFTTTELPTADRNKNLLSSSCMPNSIARR